MPLKAPSTYAWRAGRTLLAVLMVCLSATAALARPEGTARRYLTLAYEGNFDALPKAPKADTTRFEQSLRNALRVRCFRIDRVEILEVTGDAVRVDVTVSKSDRATPGSWLPPDTFPLRLKIIQDGQRWLVSAVEFPDDQLADLLLAASDEERTRLLREHDRRLTRNLARTVYLRAIRVLNYSRGTAAEVSRDATRTAALAREIAILAGDRGGEALATGIDSLNAWMQHQQLERAILLGRESLAIAESVGDPDVLARAWYNLGRAMGTSPDLAEPQYRNAVDECYRQAHSFAERAEDPSLLVRVLTILGERANQRCDHLAARRYGDRILAITGESGDIAGQIDGESLLSTVYLNQGDNQRAFFHHRRALELAEKHRSRLYVALLNRSAIFLIEEGRFDEARATYAKALPRDARGEIVWNSVVSRSTVGSALRWMAVMEARSGQLGEAECLMQQASAMPHLLAPYYMERQQPALALRASLASLAAELPAPETRIDALTAAAHAYRALGQPERALAVVEEAIELRESISDLVAGTERQQVLESDRRVKQYELAAELVLERGQALDALAYLEHARARVLTDIVENGRPGAMAELDAAQRDEQLRHERELVRLNVEVDRARASGDAAKVRALAAQLDDARAAYESFVDSLRARSERRLAGRQRPDPSAFAALIRRLPPGMIAVEYLVQDERLHLFVVRNDRSGAPAVVHRQVEIERKAVEQRVNRFMTSLAGRGLRVRDAARELYDLLIAPIARELEGADTLLVIADDALWRVPFAALADRRGRFLVERQAIVYAPSLTAYMAMTAGEATRGTSAPSLFAVGNPALHQASKSALTSFYRDATLDPLPDAEREVDVVRALYDPRRSVVLKGAAATEAATKAAIGAASVVHFATHALLDDGHPMYSRLALATDAGLAEDGWLESWEIARLDLDADVVILSACETARGTIGGGEGVIGLAWAFFLAGARSTVATQWNIASSSTADLMIAFHRSLRAEGRDPALQKAHALRDAQLALLRDPRYEHPFYWAAFVLLGDPRQ